MLEIAKQEISFGFTNETFQHGIHMCHVYNDDAERDMVLEKFVTSGLSANEKVIVLADADTPAEIDEYLAGIGLFVDKERKTGQFVIDYFIRAYSLDGRFDAQQMIERWKGYCAQAREEGYTAVRVAAEALCRQMRVPCSEQWDDYEARLDRLVCAYPFSGILCQYDASLYCGKLILDIISAHPLMVVRGQIVKNPYYIRP
ncbi:MAG: MEDS domain-containing protein [Nitrospirae bacterium]|nr:MEDS domain-containing protein [Nitrospirota bacterium]